MDFFEAFDELKRGAIVNRPDWRLRAGGTFLTMGRNVRFDDVNGTAMSHEPVLVLHTDSPQQSIVGWNPSTSDLLAKDWIVKDCKDWWKEKAVE